MKRQQYRKGLIFISFCLFPATFFYFSPVLILMASAEGTINGSWIIFLLLFLFSLLLGRAFCGWLCPAAGCQEAMFSINGSEISRGKIVKWLIWVPWLGAIGYLAYRAGGYEQIRFFYQTFNGFSIGDLPSMITYLCVLFFLIICPSLFFGKRAFCHQLCWMAPFMICGKKLADHIHLPSLRLATHNDDCSKCSTCDTHCPMSLPVSAMVKENNLSHHECILCGTCADVCKKSVIRFTMKN